MSEIKKLIERLCPDGVEYKKLGELGTFYGGLTGKSKKDFGNGNAKFITYMNVYSNPALDLSVTDTVQIAEGEKQNKVQYKDILFTGSSETPEESGMTSVVTKEIQEDFYLNSFCFGLRLFNSEMFNADFLKHYFRSHEARKAIARTASGVTRFNVSKAKLANFEIPVPPIEVQSKIVEYLDNFTELEAELKAQLEAELEARKKQYEYYRNQLLTFDKVGGARFDVKWMKLGDICDTLSGFPFDSSKFKDEGIQLMRGANIKRGNFDFSPELNKYWESSEGLEKYLLEPNDIIISMDGSLVGKSFCYLKEEHLPLLLVQRVARLRTKENFKYIYYNITNSFSDYVDKKKTAGAIPHISMKDINGFTIPLPPLEEQKRIVSILDRFEDLTTDLQSGLPAEIEARRKQYEYYREQLLTFKRNTA